MTALRATCQIDKNIRFLRVLLLASLKLLVVFPRELGTREYVLGPLLFLLHVKDIVNAVPDLNVNVFADDTNLFIEHKYLFLLNSTANEAINNPSNWFIANMLSLNVDKTCYMFFSPHRKDGSANFKILLGDLKKSIELLLLRFKYCWGVKRVRAYWTYLQLLVEI